MRTSVVAFACCALLGAPAFAQAPVPRQAEASVCRPSFTVGDAQFVAGTAFLLRTQQQTLLVTAQHLFGPGGGLDADVPWSEVPSRVRMERCETYTRGGGVWSARAPLAIENAHPGFDEADMRDLAAFPVAGEAGSLPALHLASAPPAIGEPVWLVAQTIGEPRSTALTHRGVVMAVTDHVLAFVYDQPISITATSGAPIVNARGEVVGVNYGGGQDAESGRYIGIATALRSVSAALSSR